MLHTHTRRRRAHRHACAHCALAQVLWRLKSFCGFYTARWVSQVPEPQDEAAGMPLSRLCATAQSHGPASDPLRRSVPIVDSWLPWTAPAWGPPGAMAEGARHPIAVPSSDCSNGDRVCGMLPRRAACTFTALPCGGRRRNLNLASRLGLLLHYAHNVGPLPCRFG